MQPADSISLFRFLDFSAYSLRLRASAVTDLMLETAKMAAFRVRFPQPYGLTI